MGRLILAFSSSPRIGANSDILTDKIIEGAKAAGCDVEKIQLHRCSIKPCLACGSCLESIDTPCVICDDMSLLLDKIKKADGLIFASPIYFCTVNAQMKLFLDRLNALFDANYNTLTGKKAVLAFSYADKDPLKSGVFNALQMFRDAFSALQIDLAGWIHTSCHEQKEVLNNKEILSEAVLLGKCLANKINCEN